MKRVHPARVNVRPPTLGPPPESWCSVPPWKLVKVTGWSALAAIMCAPDARQAFARANGLVDLEAVLVKVSLNGGITITIKPTRYLLFRVYQIVYRRHTNPTVSITFV